MRERRGERREHAAITRTAILPAGCDATSPPHKKWIRTACHGRRHWHVPALSGLLPALPGTSRLRLPPASTVLLRQDVGGGLSPPLEQQAPHGAHAGKHKKHGMNVQVVADPFGRLLWASPALPGAVHDVRAAREHGVVDALAEAGIKCWADKGYRGAGGTIRIPCWGRWETLSAGQKAVNRSHAKIRALVEQAIATLKSWRLLRKLRCSTIQITKLVQAVLTLHLTSSE
ncbi:transposase family protein [Streptomyces mirabilis]|uniref:transposase family protein n=1 Tax=Streptomyces mirabilis TaxID=68239 RepID=UPI0036B5F11E